MIKPKCTVAAVDFLKWMTKHRRFELPRTEYLIHHISEYGNGKPAATAIDGKVAEMTKEKAKEENASQRQEL